MTYAVIFIIVVGAIIDYHYAWGIFKFRRK